ncbi:hypothetical protein [Jannaschia sp. 2305UL9-9]|uniref:hypothetical protein n=1 Tax=Jannaschia sp. 2305UL9-9 TaxID=3121638 RepID=UPI0035274EA5
MTNDSKRDTLKAEINRERAALADSIGAFASGFSSRPLTSTVSDAVSPHAADIMQTVVASARRNPAAVALVGAGVAWLLIGGQSSRSETPVSVSPRSRQPVAGFRHDAPNAGSFEARVAQAESVHRHEMAHDGLDGETMDMSSAERMRATLAAGTSQLTEAAKARVTEARVKAIAAQEKLEALSGATVRKVRKAKSDAADNPMLLGIGAAIAAMAAAFALPRTETEDTYLGAHRDALLADAEITLRREVLAMAQAQADAIFAEVQNGMEDIAEPSEATKQSASDEQATSAADDDRRPVQAPPPASYEVSV